MFCSNCGTKLEDSVDFCPNCGKKTNRLDKNIFLPDRSKINSYNPVIPSNYPSIIIIGIIILIFGLVLFFLGLKINRIITIPAAVFIIIGLLFIFNSKAMGKSSYFKKQTKKLIVGMDINEVRAIFAFLEPKKEGFNDYNEYYICYTTKEKYALNYDMIELIFDSKGKLTNFTSSYHYYRKHRSIIDLK